jgi:predicted transposase YbfD/YdcC
MPGSVFREHFAALPDPRVPRCRRHALLDILVIALLTLLCGGRGWEDMQAFAQAKQTWLQERLGLTLEGGIPTDDTFRRVLAALDPDAFETCFRAWVRALCHTARAQQIHLDGKVVRHSFDTATGKRAVHLVRAWASELRLVLGTVAVDDKSNEIPAVRQLLTLLDLRGALVTADAEHCQRETVALIVGRGGDYLVSLKDNQPHLLADVSGCLAQVLRSEGTRRDWIASAPGRAVETVTEHDKGHGRFEMRRTSILRLAETDPDWADVQARWSGLRTLLRVERTRQIGDKQTQETAYYISSRPQSARYLGRRVRQHWQIENGLHYVLDVSLGEDASRIRRDNAAINLGTMRNMVINLLRDKSRDKSSVPSKQKKAGWNNDYMLELFA